MQDGRKYYCFTKDTPLTDAVANFVKKYGVEPQETFEMASMLWVGPVPEKET